MTGIASGKSREAKEKRALERALYYISIKERSRREVSRWLLDKGYDKEDIENALNHLIRMGMLDDARLAEMIAERASQKAWGRSRALAEMASRGIDRETGETALDRAYPDDELSIALKAALLRWEKLPGDDLSRERKLVSWMARMGYSPSTAFRILDILRKEGGEGRFP